MAPIFQNWCFEPTKGTQPDFVLKGDKNYCVLIRDHFVVDPTTHLKNGYLKRITSIKINTTPRGNFYSYLNCYPHEFSNLTSLDLDNVGLTNESLLVLAPNLENLRLANTNNVRII